MTIKAKRQRLSSVKQQREEISRRRRAQRGTLYPHLVGTAGGHTWKGNKDDGFEFADDGQEAQMMHTAVVPDSGHTTSCTLKSVHYPSLIDQIGPKPS